MGACTSSPRAKLTDASHVELAKKSRAAAHIRAAIPADPMVSTPEAVYLTNQASWAEEHSNAADEGGQHSSSSSFTIKAEGKPQSSAAHASSTVIRS